MIKKLRQDKLKEICFLLCSTNVILKVIAKQVGVTNVDVIERINNGVIYIAELNGLGYSDFPIRKSSLDGRFTALIKDLQSGFTLVSTSTLAESPMAYKPKEAILSVIGETVDVLEVIKPVYNFKASE